MTADVPTLELRDLRTRFHTRDGVLPVVDGVSFTLARGKVLGLVGESGSGKSVTGFSIMGLVDPPGRVEGGQVLFQGRDLLQMSNAQRRALRGDRIAMIFQDPMATLNPVYRVGDQIAEAIRTHENTSKAAARRRVIELLKQVGIPNPERRVDDFPHQFSGGMRQRAMIAMALANDPDILIADEPTTALDVTIQAQILDLMQRLRRDHGSSIVLITHDMGVVSGIADDVLVMYGGRAAETGSRAAVFHTPSHPYTWGLLSSVPRTDRPRTRRLSAIPGQPLSPLDVPPGCRFAPRCRFAHDACAVQPPLEERALRHVDACWLPVADRPELRRQSDAAAEQARA